MNDDALITAVKEPFAGERMDVPAEQIVRRGQALRTHRRLRGVAGGALAAAGAAALAVTTLLPSTQPGTQLAAWTVAKQADGSVKVTIHQLRDPAGLQRKLRAEGVPASVTFDNRPSPPCRVFTETATDPGHPGETVTFPDPGLTFIRLAPAQSGPVVLIIDASRIPSGAGAAIYSPYRPHGHGSRRLAIGTAKVHTSPACTG